VIAELVDSLGGLLDVLTDADAARKCDLYRELGVSMTYQHPERVVVSRSGGRAFPGAGPEPSIWLSRNTIRQPVTTERTSYR